MGTPHLTFKTDKLSWVFHKDFMKATHVIKNVFLLLTTKVKHIHCGKFRNLVALTPENETTKSTYILPHYPETIAPSHFPRYACGRTGHKSDFFT